MLYQITAGTQESSSVFLVCATEASPAEVFKQLLFTSVCFYVILYYIFTSTHMNEKANTVLTVVWLKWWRGRDRGFYLITKIKSGESRQGAVQWLFRR